MYDRIYIQVSFFCTGDISLKSRMLMLYTIIVQNKIL